tara:strand:- start:666 stop:863 length:198 start_codon:yes stop_codon:yes gene_type:complete
MKSKEERRRLHTTTLKTTKQFSPRSTSSNRTSVIKDINTSGTKKIWQETKVEGQTLYVELKTTKE